jgi:hypothetical protein
MSKAVTVISLYFKQQAMMARRGMVIYPHAFASSALDGINSSDSLPVPFTYDESLHYELEGPEPEWARSRIAPSSYWESNPLSRLNYSDTLLKELHEQ